MHEQAERGSRESNTTEPCAIYNLSFQRHDSSPEDNATDLSSQGVGQEEKVHHHGSGFGPATGSRGGASPLVESQS